jgi:hypothetical protein
VRRHGGQTQSGSQMDAMKRHLVDAVFHRTKASFRSVSGGVHLVRQFLNQRLQPIELGVTVCRDHISMTVSSRLS